MDLIEPENKSQNRLAAVMVLHERATDSLMLTQRSAKLHNHPGEICFPGGSWQEGDQNFYNTALRELYEELGISSERVQLVREMIEVHTLTGYIIHPWLASIDNLVPYHADSSEVASVFCLPMRDVVKAASYCKITVRRLSLAIKSYQFTASEQFVWGATTRIMMQLIEKKGRDRA